MKSSIYFLIGSCLLLQGCGSWSHSHCRDRNLAEPLGTIAVDHKDHGAGVKVEILAESDSSWDGAKLPAYPTEAPQISVVKVTIPPHSKLSWHKHPSMNAGYMISGAILVTAEDGQERVVKAGEGLIETVNTWHYGRNDSDLPAEIVVVYSGVRGRPLAIIKASE